ncbi:MAG: macro domain-containing protein [Candidatus Woesearchaeota archaeon]|jgi:O-acetyl-ADP-ribose deacetylase (regulator of RNase III)|nr:macro domain-containing protein [Candidatus Woesearchaeota archaeon]
MYREIKGNLITLALSGTFDVIAHGCNCFCTMGAGIAKDIRKNFKEAYSADLQTSRSDYLKMGNYSKGYKSDLWVINAYIQYYYGQNSPGCNQSLDYEALTVCLRKINQEFFGQHIGLPQIGCGLAGGDWNKVKEIIQKELINCNVTVVIYEKPN